MTNDRYPIHFIAHYSLFIRHYQAFCRQVTVFCRERYLFPRLQQITREDILLFCFCPVGFGKLPHGTVPLIGIKNPLIGGSQARIFGRCKLFTQEVFHLTGNTAELRMGSQVGQAVGVFFYVIQLKFRTFGQGQIKVVSHAVHLIIFNNQRIGRTLVNIRKGPVGVVHSIFINAIHGIKLLRSVLFSF